MTTTSQFTLSESNGLVYKPHPRFLAQNLSKKVRLIHESLRYLYDWVTYSKLGKPCLYEAFSNLSFLLLSEFFQGKIFIFKPRFGSNSGRLRSSCMRAIVVKVHLNSLTFLCQFLVTKQMYDSLSLIELYMYMTYFVYLLDGIFLRLWYGNQKQELLIVFNLENDIVISQL